MNSSYKSRFVRDIYNFYGGTGYMIGEDMTQKQHAIRTYKLLKDRGQPDNVCLAGFLHDIGHPFSQAHNISGKDQYGCFRHERVGAELLARLGVSTEVVALTDLHVDAKRYMRTKFPETILSSASDYTFFQQGGNMENSEKEAFEDHTLFTEALYLRQADEDSKSVEFENEDELFEEALKLFRRDLLDGERL